MRQTEISLNQLTILLLNHLIPPALIFASGVEIGPDAWLAGLLGIAISLGLALLFLKLATWFPGRTLIAINDTVWGPRLGKACSAVFLLFYLLVSFLVLNLTTQFQKEYLMNTPALVLALIGSALSFLMVSCGLEVIARCSQMITNLFLIPFTLLITILLIPEMQLTNLQPLFRTPFPLLLQTALRVGVFSFDTGFAYLMTFALVRGRKYSQVYPAIVKAFAVGAGFHLLVIDLMVLTLGPTAGYSLFPFLHTVNLINIGEVFSRMDVLSGIMIWLWNLFYQTTLLYNFTAATGEFFRLKSYRTLCLPLGILLSLLSVHSFSSSVDDFQFAPIYLWLCFPFQYILPLLTLLVAVVRRLPRKEP